MSLNTAHANNGVLIHGGEHILLFSENVAIDFSGHDSTAFKGTKTGKIYLTTHRIIFNNRAPNDDLLSLSMPFVCLTDMQVDQPVFGANNIRGKLRAQTGGHFTGEVKFKMVFKSGGAIDFAQCALKAAFISKKYGGAAADSPPPYCAPTGAWHQAPPPAYSMNPQGYYGWIPATQAFPNGPPPNTVFMNDQPPPYPGLVVPGSQPTANGFAGGPPTYPGAGDGLPGYPGQQQPAYNNGAGAYGGFAPASGHNGYAAPGGQPAAYGVYPAAGLPTFAGYPPAAGTLYNGSAAGGVYPPMAPAPAGAAAPYPYAAGPSSGNGVFPPASDKEREAAQSAAASAQRQPPYPGGSSSSSNPQPNAPPPDYNEPPPSYNSLADKKQQ